MRSLIMAAVLVLFAGHAAAQAPKLEPLGSFGCFDCAGPLLFTSVQAIAVTADGRIIVADRSEPRIRVFDGRGRVQVAFGRTGAGPGEVRLPIRAVADDSTITVVDMTNRQIVRYNRAGALQTTRRIDGFAVAAAFPPYGGEVLLGLSDFSQSDLVLRRTVRDTFALVRSVGAGELPERTNGHLELAPIAVARDGSFVVGDGIGAYRIARFRADGTYAGAIVRDVARERRSPEEIAAITDQRSRNLARVRAMVGAEGGRASDRPLPPISPTRNYFDMNSLAFDELDRLWVRVERGPRNQTTFDVFDMTGRLLGEVRVAAQVREYALGAGMLAGVSYDELDVARVSVWRVSH
jgi:hypothetical protein